MVFICIAAMLLYGLASILVFSRLTHAQGPNRLLVTGVAGIAVGLHGFLLSQTVITESGLNFSMTNVLSVVVWIIALSFTVVMPRMKMIVVAPVVYACAVIAVALLCFIPQSYHVQLEANSGLLTHIVLSLMAYSALLIAALYAIQLYFIQRQLKNKQAMISAALPPLMTVEKQLYHLVMIGMSLLTLSLASGFIFLDNMFAEGQGHKAILSMVAWLLYAIMLIQHQKFGCKIRTAVLYTLTGASLLSLAYFGARIVKELILQ